MAQQSEKPIEGEMLFQVIKPARGTAFTIYTTGVVEIKTVVSKSGVHIPTGVLQWLVIDVSTNSEQEKQQIKVLMKEDREPFRTIAKYEGCEFVKTVNGWYLTLPQGSICKNGTLKIKCFIKGLLPTEQFHQVLNIYKQVILTNNNNRQLLFTVGKKSLCKIYRTSTGLLQVECHIEAQTLSYHYGRFELSGEIARYIKNWWTLGQQFVIAKFADKQLAVKCLLKHNKGRKKRYLILPHRSPSKNIQIVFSHPTFELTQNAKKDLCTAASYWGK